MKKSNVKHANLCHQMTPIRMSSSEASKALKIKADLVYLDAGPSNESVSRNILAWYPNLNEGGILCEDEWTWKSVRLAVSETAKIFIQSVYSSGNFWRFY